MIGNRLSNELLKKRELDILFHFHNYCEENNLKYWLTSGSMLGAVRHKGFIPWDDDIDVAMPREDYMRLIDIYPQEGINGIKLLTPFTQEKCPITFGKLYDSNTLKMDNEVEDKYQQYGIDIDIFPWDKALNSTKDIKTFYKRQYLRFKMFLGIVGKFRVETSMLKTVFKFFFMIMCKFLAIVHVLNSDKIAKKMNFKAMELNSNKYICSSMQPSRKPVKCAYPKEWFENLILMKFEEYEFFVPNEYDLILKNMYGNYMELPPISQQVTHHLSNAYKKHEEK